MTTNYSPGKYKGRVMTWELGESRDKHTPQLKVTFMLMGMIGPNDTTVTCQPFERSLYIYFTPKTIERAVKNLREQLGYDQEGFEFLDPKHAEAVDLEGKEIEVECKHETYNGEDREKWDFPWENTPFDRKKISELNATFGNALRNHAARTGGAAPAGATSQGHKAMKEAEQDAPF